MDMGAAYLLGAGLLGLFGFLAVHAWRTRERTGRLARSVLDRGWSFAAGKPPVIHEVTGAVAGLPFTAVSRRPAGMLGQNRGNAPTITMVTVPATRIEGAVAALPAMPDTAGLAFAKALAGDLFAEILLGDDAPAVEALPDVTAAFGGSFPSGYKVSASTGELALHHLGTELRQTLSDLAESRGRKRPVVLICRGTQASVRVLETVSDPDEIEALVRLAVLLARAC